MRIDKPNSYSETLQLHWKHYKNILKLQEGNSDSKQASKWYKWEKWPISFKSFWGPEKSETF